MAVVWGCAACGLGLVCLRVLRRREPGPLARRVRWTWTDQSRLSPPVSSGRQSVTVSGAFTPSATAWLAASLGPASACRRAVGSDTLFCLILNRIVGEYVSLGDCLFPSAVPGFSVLLRSEMRFSA